MKKIVNLALIIMLLISGIGSIVSSSQNIVLKNDNINQIDDLSCYQYYLACEGIKLKPYQNQVNINRLDYPIGTTIWQYTISTSWDNSPKAISPIPDINNDGIDDVIVCSEDDYIRCFDGSAIGTGIILWEHMITAGDIHSQRGLDIIEDVDGDGFEDVVVGATGGARLIRCISGDDGSTIWTHDTHEYGNGGWVYQVDCSFDYNNDNITDVLATTGDDSSGTGPKRVYCLNGLDGLSIWERPLGGPGFSVIGIEDFTGDGEPDVLAGASNEYETIGYAYGINGATSTIQWTFTTSSSSVWALEQLDDFNSDNTKDVIIGDFSGNIYGLDSTTGNQIYSNSIGSAIITRFAKLNDVNNDGHPDIVPAHSTSHITQAIDGQTGDFIWSHSVADQPWNVARIADVSGDGIDDVLVGTLFINNYCYFLNGTDGSELASISYNEAVDAIMAIPDVVDDGSMEMIAGGRDGKVTCISGGLDAYIHPIRAEFTANITEGKIPLSIQFTDLSTSENSTIISWEWDFDNDGFVDSYEQNPQWTYFEVGLYTVQLEVSNGTLFDIETKIDYITALPSNSDLNCYGSISWTDVEPGSIVTKDINIENIGEPLSLLDWEVLSYPDWGNWTFDPDSGLDIPDDEYITIEVIVETPNEAEQTFTGDIIFVNSENFDDTCTIDVSLATPVNIIKVEKQIPRFIQNNLNLFLFIKTNFLI